MRLGHRQRGAVGQRPAGVVDAIADPRREQPPGDGDHQLAADRLDVIGRRVVLEEHRQPAGVAEQCLREVRVRTGRLPKGNGEIGLAGHPDIQVGGAVGGPDLAEHPLQPAAQDLGHTLAADESPQLPVAQVQAARRRGIQQGGKERRVAADDVAGIRAEQLDGGQCLVGVGPARLDRAHPAQRRRHRRAGGPGAHREAVEDHDPVVAAGSQHPLRLDGQATFDLVQFGTRAKPLIGTARRAGGFVELGTGGRQLAAAAALGQRIAVDVTGLVQHRKRGEVAGQPAGLEGRAPRTAAQRRRPEGRHGAPGPRRGEDGGDRPGQFGQGSAEPAEDGEAGRPAADGGPGQPDHRQGQHTCQQLRQDADGAGQLGNGNRATGKGGIHVAEPGRRIGPADRDNYSTRAE